MPTLPSRPSPAGLDLLVAHDTAALIAGGSDWIERGALPKARHRCLARLSDRAPARCRLRPLPSPDRTTRRQASTSRVFPSRPVLNGC